MVDKQRGRHLPTFNCQQKSQQLELEDHEDDNVNGELELILSSLTSPSNAAAANSGSDDNGGRYRFSRSLSVGSSVSSTSLVQQSPSTPTQSIIRKKCFISRLKRWQLYLVLIGIFVLIVVANKKSIYDKPETKAPKPSTTNSSFSSSTKQSTTYENYDDDDDDDDDDDATINKSQSSIINDKSSSSSVDKQSDDSRGGTGDRSASLSDDEDDEDGIDNTDDGSDIEHSNSNGGDHNDGTVHSNSDVDVNDSGATDSTTISSNTETNLPSSTNSSTRTTDNFQFHPLSNMTYTDQQLAFRNRWCDVAKPKEVSWIPTEPNLQWQQRSPYAILPGEQHCGSDILTQSLSSHPLVKSIASHGFFMTRAFEKYTVAVKPSTTTALQSSNTNSTFTNSSSMGRTKYPKWYHDEDSHPTRQTRVYQARERMYAVHSGQQALKQNTNLISMDATPGYWFYSTQVPQRILCVAPWSKIVVLVRNPIDRVYSHYLEAVKKGFPKSLEFFIDQDLFAMKGNLWNSSADEEDRRQRLLRRGRRRRHLKANSNSTNDRNFSSSSHHAKKSKTVQEREDEEDEAWQTYQKKGGVRIVGRSLYVIPLRHWIHVYRDAGKDPRKEILIVQYEQLQANPQTEYSKILQFLDLPDHTWNLPTFVTKPQTRMTNEFRKTLKEFFEPYNERFFQLVKKEFGKDWSGSWN